MDESGKGIKITTDGVTAAEGFKATSTVTGIKCKDRQDAAMIYSQRPCRSAGIFTTNVVKAVPVKRDKNQVTNGMSARAVVMSAGIANAYIGEESMGYCEQIVEAAVQTLGIPAESILVVSTGTIDMQLPMDRITAGVKAMVPLLNEGLRSDTGASRTIMATDIKNEEVTVQSELEGSTVTTGGIYKGSSMTHPNVCTMLSLVTTDVAISRGLLRKTLSQNIRDTYNMISVDGDTSTSDTVLLLVNGLAGSREIIEKGEDYHIFCRASKIVNETLTKKMVGNGEGCTALSEMKIVGAETEKQARVLAKPVICLSLIKAAIFGHDADWGRILCTMGYSRARFDPERVDLYFESATGEMQIAKDDAAVGYSEEQTTRILSEPAVTVAADTEMGDAKATVWSYGPTFDYVRISADYRS